MAIITRWTAADAERLESAVSGYIAQGFVVANRTPTSVTLVKRKQFSIVMLVIGLILCVVPLFLYLVYYAMQQDQVFELTLAQASPQVSADGRWCWNGTAWTPVDVASPTAIAGVPIPPTTASEAG